MSASDGREQTRPVFRECYRCEHYAAEHDDPDGKCRCIVLDVLSDEECKCPAFVPDEPPHLAEEWAALSAQERGNFVTWLRERGGSW